MPSIVSACAESCIRHPKSDQGHGCRIKTVAAAAATVCHPVQAGYMHAPRVWTALQAYFTRARASSGAS